jgi:hypothetical protein
MPHGSVKIRGGAKQFSNDQLVIITQLIQSFDDFRQDGDVGELHDNGVVEFEAVKVVWKIEANGKRFETATYNSKNEAPQPVIIIMLAGEG